MVSIAVEVQDFLPSGRHKQVAVWSGPDAEHRAHCGHLVMREDEALELGRRVNGQEPPPVTYCSECGHPTHTGECDLDCATCVVEAEENQLRHECYSAGRLKDRDGDFWKLDEMKGGWQIVLPDGELGDERIDFQKLLDQTAPLVPAKEEANS